MKKLALSLAILSCGRLSPGDDGLSGDSGAVNVARISYTQLVVEKNQLGSYLRAQEKFVTDIENSLEENQKAITEDNFERAIIVKANSLTAGKSVSESDVYTTLEKDLEGVIGTYQTGQASIVAQQSALNASFKQIASLDQQYQTLEQSLLRLSQPKSFRDNATNFADFVTSAVKAYQSDSSSKSK